MSDARRLLVLDLDGTLVDSAEDLRASANRVLAARGLAPLAPGEIRPMIGDGVAMLVARAFAARGGEPDASAVEDFLADYGADPGRFSRLFPGVGDMLGRAQAEGWALAVCTNKPVQAARTLLGGLGIAGRFAAIGGGDSFASRKPDPAHVLGTIALAGGSAGRSVMMGDHRNDVLAAAGAGIPSIFAAWGYGTPAMQEGAGAVAESPGEVTALAGALLRDAAGGHPRTIRPGPGA